MVESAVSNPSKHSSESPRKIIKLAGDCISSLPDAILHSILSYIPTRLAITTSVLSKRWKHVWCKTPSISVDSFPDCYRVDSISINKTLSNYTAPKIMSFNFCSCYSITTSQIDSWMAMSRNAENLDLTLRANQYRFQDFFFNNSSLRQLSVAWGYLSLTPRCIVSWPSLRSMSLAFCEFSDESIANILSGCPMLESLTMNMCNGFDHLDLSKSMRLTRLDICIDDMDLPRPMEIVSPHIHYLRYKNIYRPVNLMNVSSLTEAKLSRFYISVYPFRDADFDFIQDTMVKMLAKLQNIQKLTIEAKFLEFLSLAELRGVPFPQFKIKDLTIKTRIIPSVIPGIVRLLQNSPGLKKLTNRTKKLNAIRHGNQHWHQLKRYLNRQGLNPDHCWSGKYGVDFPADDEAETKHVVSFVELLLEHAKTLETMVLRLDDYLSATEYQKILPTVSSRHKTNIKIVP